MKKNLIFCGFLTIFGIVLYLTIPPLGADDSQQTAVSTKVAFICRESKEIVFVEPQPAPAINPITGRPTLDRALYCTKCESWRAIPPAEIYHGNPLMYPCPVHNERMRPEGPAASR